MKAFLWSMVGPDTNIQTDLVDAKADTRLEQNVTWPEGLQPQIGMSMMYKEAGGAEIHGTIVRIGVDARDRNDAELTLEVKADKIM